MESLSLSFASEIAVSPKPIITTWGMELIVSTSILISYTFKPTVVALLTVIANYISSFTTFGISFNILILATSKLLFKLKEVL